MANYWDASEVTFPDLQRYADAQNTTIKMLCQSRKEAFTQSEIPEWKEVWEATWKRGEPAFRRTVDVVRDAERFDDSLLPDIVPERCNIATIHDRIKDAWEFNCESLFIRSEYEEAQKAAIWVCGSKESGRFDNMVFSGSPGIGKSGLLLLILLERLAAGLPTGLQIHSNYSLLFWEGGVLEFAHQEDIRHYGALKGTEDPLSRIWILVDLNTNLKEPTGAFSNCRPFFVVVSASPNLEHHNWTKKTTSFPFFLKPWTFSEVLQARSLVIPNSPPSEHALWAFYSDYCPSPRVLFFKAMCPDIYISLVHLALERVSPETARELLQDPNLVWGASDLLVLIEPSPTFRFKGNRRLVSNYVFEQLSQKHQLSQQQVPEHLSESLLKSFIPRCITF